MMRVIARKKGGMGALYGFVAFIGILLIPLGISQEETALVFAGIVLGAISGVIFAISLSTPKNVISTDDSGTLILHFKNDMELPISQLTDVSYRRASARGIQYQWGKITLSTLSGTYSCDFVADVEEVSKELTRLMYSGNQYSGGYRI